MVIPFTPIGQTGLLQSSTQSSRVKYSYAEKRSSLFNRTSGQTVNAKPIVPRLKEKCPLFEGENSCRRSGNYRGRNLYSLPGRLNSPDDSKGHALPAAPCRPRLAGRTWPAAPCRPHLAGRTHCHTVSFTTNNKVDIPIYLSIHQPSCRGPHRVF
jgi:hypothetical protein